MRTSTAVSTLVAGAVVSAALALTLAGCGVESTTTTTAPPETTTTTVAETTTTAPETTTTTAPPETTTTTASVPSPPTAAAAWTQVVASQSYRAWRTAPGHETPQPATGPHGVTDQVFANEALFAALEGPAASEWPVDSVIVKDVYDGGGALLVIEYMQRTAEGWYYVTYRPDGRAVTEGLKVAGCEGCHSRGSDSVFTFALP